MTIGAIYLMDGVHWAAELWTGTVIFAALEARDSDRGGRRGVRTLSSELRWLCRPIGQVLPQGLRS